MILIGSIKQETNTFSEVETTLENFSSSYLYYKEEIVKKLKTSHTEVGGFLDILRQTNYEILPTVAASSISGGRVREEDYFILKNSIIEPLEKEKSNINAVLLSLHGAMATTDIDDTEGDLLATIRKMVGPDIPIAVSLDPHAHVSDLMIQNADILYSYRTFPHVDQYETGQRTAELLIKLLEKEFVPIMKAVKIPMLVSPESQEDNKFPMKDIFSYLHYLEKSKDIVAISYCPVQPWLDIPNTASVILVISNNQAELAESTAIELAKKVWSFRTEFLPQRYSPEKAVNMATTSETVNPTALVESADSTLAGAPGDGVTLLKTLIDMNVEVTSYVTIVDSSAVDQCFNVGTGNIVNVNVGRDRSADPNTPLPISGKIIYLNDNAEFFLQATRIQEGMGRTAVVKIGNIFLVLCSFPFAHQDPNSYESLGLKLSEARIVGIKSTLHFRAFYTDHVDSILLIEDQGVSSGQFDQFSWKRLTRPVWPLDKTATVKEFISN